MRRRSELGIVACFLVVDGEKVLRYEAREPCELGCLVCPEQQAARPSFLPSSLGSLGPHLLVTGHLTSIQRRHRPPKISPLRPLVNCSKW